MGHSVETSVGAFLLAPPVPLELALGNLSYTWICRVPNRRLAVFKVCGCGQIGLLCCQSDSMPR